MKKLLISAIVCWVLASGPSLAVEPVDSYVKGALVDLARYEKQFAGKTSANAATVKRTLRLLSLTRDRLDQSPNTSHESWLDADKRYKTLVAKLNGFLSPGGSGSTQGASNEANTQKAPPAARSSSGGAPQPMISHYRVRIKKIARDIQSRMDTMDQAGPKPFQDPAYVKKYQEAAQRFRESFAPYGEYKDDPDVVTAVQLLIKFETMMKFGQSHAAKELAELGDVQARLAAIQQRVRQLKRPPTPQEPYDVGELEQWLTQLATVRPQALEAYKPLPVIKQRAYLPNNRLTVEQGGPYDLQDVDRLERGLLDLVDGIDKERKAFEEHLDRVAANLKTGLAHYEEFDPADRNDQANHFLSAGRADEIRAQLARARQTAVETARYAQLMSEPAYRQRLGLIEAEATATEANVPPATTATALAQVAPVVQTPEPVKPKMDPVYEARLELVKAIDAATAHYEANHKRALALVRMPKAATEDAELTAIARKTLANYDYVGDFKRLVVNTKKVHRTKETSEDEYDDVDVSLSGTVTLTGTRTTYSYAWDEFQVATAEPVGEKYYIFYSTLKYFTSGDNTTPLNRWVISARIQGSEIPEENIGK